MPWSATRGDGWARPLAHVARLLDDVSQTREIEPLLRKLTAPTLIVWGTGDHFFPLKWAYWLKGLIPGARHVVELEAAK